MLFNSFIFLFFLIIVVPVFYLIPQKYKNPFLLAASLFFYGYWDWRFLFLILFSIITDYILGRAIYNGEDAKQKKLYVSISVVKNLLLLGFFKYYNFFVDSFNSMISPFGQNLDFLHLNIILPVGISFFTFQTMTYTIDIYRNKLKPAKSLVNYALYVSFFPQLVAGPIERATDLLPQVEREKGRFHYSNFKEGIALITVGMFKKVLIGDTTARIVDQIFANPSYYSSLELLMSLILFAIQIYADFSGYSSIARGTGRLMGFTLTRNFRQPYFSANITEFWRRWHISLSTWIKDYIYIPLGGNRGGRTRTYINLFIAMLLAGLWHGAAWTYVVFGGLHGTYLCIHRWYLKGKKVPDKYTYNGIAGFAGFAARVIIMDIILVFTLLVFRAPNFTTVFYYFERFINWNSSPFAPQIMMIMVVYGIAVFLLDFAEYYTGKDDLFLLEFNYPVRYGIVFSGWVVTLLYMFEATPLPFVYFQF